MKLLLFSAEEIGSLEPFLSDPLYRGFDREQFVYQRANTHILVTKQGIPQARCSIWHENTPCDQEGVLVGTIGHFEAIDAHAAALMLVRAEGLLKLAGRRVIVAPMDGTTYGNYRFQTKSDGNADFLLEPVNPSSYPRYLVAEGYIATARYRSTLEQPIKVEAELTRALTKQLRHAGIEIKNVDLAQLSTMLDEIYDISIECFSQNPYYTDISRAAFHAQYLGLKGYLDPRFIFLAYHEGRAIGFLFGIPDYLQMGRKEPMNRLILKTIAVLPQYRRKKVGSAFFALARGAAVKAGFDSIINALAYQENMSLLLSRNLYTMREYTLYKKELQE